MKVYLFGPGGGGCFVQFPGAWSANMDTGEVVPAREFTVPDPRGVPLSAPVTPQGVAAVGHPFYRPPRRPRP